MADWEQDFEKAKKAAADQHKNVLVLFDASDASDAKARFRSSRFNESVASSREFADKASKDYVCVYIDNPQGDEAKAKVRDLARNKKMTAEFGITIFPTVIVMDSGGRVFGVMDDYTLNGVTAFLALMKQWDEDAKNLFDLLDRSKDTSDTELIGKTLDFLELNNLDGFYPDIAKELARKLRGGGQREVTEQDEQMWIMRFYHASQSPDNVKREVQAFDVWKTKRSFKQNPEFGARLHITAAVLLIQAGEKDAAKKKCEEAATFNSKDSGVRRMLDHDPASPQRQAR